MTAPAVVETSTRRPGRRLRAVPQPVEVPLTVTISIDGGAPAGRERVLAALRELVSAAGADAVSLLPADPPAAPALAAVEDAGLITLEPKPRAAFRRGRLLDLSRLEFDLLMFFATHPRQVFTRSQLLAQVWGHVHTGARTVDVHISRLRTKLGEPELITTVYGVGYRLSDDAPIAVG
ncbi:winged helix-turn-helix domain-containing protein [Jidongwangia harbinensis]|uniref:winged helix-turn-helix domain-containing protein n=1 Tax=Jidongwangia harbinensis TaxID=2878561 RepID=UPI001CDA3435|nr:winged helix-turn-helix domain-containing protein [Jidongwangia harbinensis]MCA2217696.1 winged helix-turn-helix domain-containing protein [Jidongwangia harbinensis]